MAPVDAKARVADFVPKRLPELGGAELFGLLSTSCGLSVERGAAREQPDCQGCPSPSAGDPVRRHVHPCELVRLFSLGETPEPSARPQAACWRVSLLTLPQRSCSIFSLTVTTAAGQVAFLLRAAQAWRAC